MARKIQKKCAFPNCGKLFEHPPMLAWQLDRILKEQGWKRRGAMTGPVYYCDGHGN